MGHGSRRGRGPCSRYRARLGNQSADVRKGGARRRASGFEREPWYKRFLDGVITSVPFPRPPLKNTQQRTTSKQTHTTKQQMPFLSIPDSKTFCPRSNPHVASCRTLPRFVRTPIVLSRLGESMPMATHRSARTSARKRQLPNRGG